jgi:CRP-like cAMP-binding protein
MRLFSHDTKVEALRNVPLFANLSKKELAQLARVSEDVELDAGSVLCKEGQIGHEFFVLVDGTVRVSRKGRRVATFGGGDFLGEIALLEDTPRTATVTAETPLRLFVLTRPAFRSLLETSPEIEGKVLRTLVRRLAEVARDPALA